jgi:hypothetical protein
VSQLLPDGIADVRDLPHHVYNLVRRALVFLGFDDLDEDERPPRRLWLDDDGLGDHFKVVRQRRAEKYSGGGDKSSPGPIEDPVSNDAASLLIAE